MSKAIVYNFQQIQKLSSPKVFEKYKKIHKKIPVPESLFKNATGPEVLYCEFFRNFATASEKCWFIICDFKKCLTL